MEPILSVIVPVYKVESYLRQCLDSLVNQTYRDMEIIAIDDGSPDNCGAICDEYATKYPQMRVIHKRNAGVSAARNQGIEEAKGTWIAFVDSDDWCETDYYESLFHALDGREVDVLCANGYIEELNNKSVLVQNAYRDFEYHDREHLDNLMLQVEAPECGKLQGESSPHGIIRMAFVWNKLYRRQFLRNYGLRFSENLKIWEDNLFNYLVFYKAEKVAGCNVIAYHYRQHSVSVMHEYNPDILNTSYGFIDAVWKATPEKMGNPIFREALCARSLNLMSCVLRLHYLHPSNPDARPVVKKRIREMTRMPYFHNALYRSDGRFLARKQVVLKYLLRQPFLWPLELAFKVKARLQS